MCRMTALIALLLVQFANSAYAEIGAEVDASLYGAKGDGMTDDTESLQKALTVCSEKGLTCRIPGGKNFLVTSPIYLWGDASLKAESGTGAITFNVESSPYLLNIGISGRNKLEKPFTGVISGIKFNVKGGSGGRILFLWRTIGAGIYNNIFDVGGYAYSATSSGNDNAWVKNGFENSIRKNISIVGNTITAMSDDLGSEGIGLGHFDGALISNNTIVGVGDDPIGIHFCRNVTIKNNYAKSVDGRIFVSNSKNVEIAYNRHERMRSARDGKFYKGISLLYVGFETLKKNNFSAPTNTSIHDNYLYYPEGAIDHGAAIYLYGIRGAIVELNTIANDSADVKATALHLLPAPFSGLWSDPDGIDFSNIARVGDVRISRNVSNGRFPRDMIMTGNCVDYRGKVVVENNAASGFTFYCDQVRMRSNQ